MEKKKFCNVDPVELAEKINIIKLEGTKKCVIEFDGEYFVSKNCTPDEIKKKIKAQCSCTKCGRIKL